MDEIALLGDLYTAAITGVLLGVVLALVLRDFEKRGREFSVPRMAYVVVLLLGAAMAMYGQGKLIAALFDKELTIGFVGTCTFLTWVGIWILMRPLYSRDKIEHGAIAYVIGLILALGGFVFAAGTGVHSTISTMQYGALVLAMSIPLAAHLLSMLYGMRKAAPAATQ
jgi:hypothetical protein